MELAREDISLSLPTLVSIVDSSAQFSEVIRNQKKTRDTASTILPATELFEKNLLCRADFPDRIGEKIEELEKRFNILIQREGNEVKKPYVNFGYGTVKDKLLTRKPTMSELEGLEAALHGTQPLSTPMDGKTKIKFYFLPEPFLKGDPSIAMYARDEAETPAVFIYATGTKDRPATEVDTKEEPTWQTKTFSLQRMLTHELSHYYQDRNGWSSDKAPPEMAKVLGWLKLNGERANEYAFKGSDGTLYRHCGPGAVLIDDSFISIREARWVPCDENGKFMKGASDKMLTTKQMSEKAAVKPVTSYFDNPKEMHAESLCAFRLDAKWRANLLRADVTLYRFIKDQDQREIDKVFRTAPGKLRHPYGKLVSATDQNKKAVAEFEKNASKQN